MARLGAIALLGVLAMACGDRGAPPSPERIIGLVTEVEPEDETEIPTSFTVEDEDGTPFSIEIDPELDYGFDLLHVREHLVTQDPVDVSVEERDGALIATSIEDG